jgi:hypothetical protein
LRAPGGGDPRPSQRREADTGDGAPPNGVVRTVAIGQPPTDTAEFARRPWGADGASVPQREPANGGPMGAHRPRVQAKGDSKPAVHVLTRVDVACRHLGARGAGMIPGLSPARGDRNGVVDSRQKSAAGPGSGLVLRRLEPVSRRSLQPLLTYPGTPFVNACGVIEYKYREKKLLTSILYGHPSRHAQLHTTKYLGTRHRADLECFSFRHSPIARLACKLTIVTAYLS